jgi:hypothetical protein
MPDSTLWLCRCGETGAAPDEPTAMRDWRVHHNARHGGRIAAEQLELAEVSS